MIVQIYEIQTPEQAEKCVAAGVDHIGSVLTDKDHWQDPVLKETVAVSARAGAKSSLIPIFTDRAVLSRALSYYRPDYIHLCDTLTDASGQPLNLDPFVRQQHGLRKEFPDLGIIRTIPVSKQGLASDLPVLDIARAFEGVSDYFLIDTWVPASPVAGYIGVTGEAADWDTASHVVRHVEIPVILAGGLAPDNVYDALMQVKPAGADSCTQTNALDSDGQPIRFQKDLEKVSDFVGEVRRAEAALNQEMAALEKRLQALREELQDREKALPPIR